MTPERINAIGAWLNHIEAQLDDTTPYYLPELVKVLREAIVEIGEIEIRVRLEYDKKLQAILESENQSASLRTMLNKKGRS